MADQINKYGISRLCTLYQQSLFAIIHFVIIFIKIFQFVTSLAIKLYLHNLSTSIKIFQIVEHFSHAREYVRFCDCIDLI